MKQKRVRDQDRTESGRPEKKKRDPISFDIDESVHPVWEFVATEPAHVLLFQRLLQLEEPVDRSPFAECFVVQLKLVSGWTSPVVQESKSLPLDVLSAHLRQLVHDQKDSLLLQDSVRFPHSARQIVWREAFSSYVCPFVSKLAEAKVVLSKCEDGMFFCAISHWIRSWISAFYCHKTRFSMPTAIELEQVARLVRAVVTQQLTCDELHASMKDRDTPSVFRACILAWQQLLCGRDHDQGLSHALLIDSVGQAQEQLRVLAATEGKCKTPLSVCKVEVFWSLSDLLTELCREGRWVDGLIIQHRYRDTCARDDIVAIRLETKLTAIQKNKDINLLFVYPLNTSSLVVIGSPMSMAGILLDRWVVSKDADSLCLLRLLHLVQAQTFPAEKLFRAILYPIKVGLLDSKRVDACVAAASHASNITTVFGSILQGEEEVPPPLLGGRLNPRITSILQSLIRDTPPQPSAELSVKLIWMCSVMVACTAQQQQQQTRGFLFIKNILDEGPLSLSDCLMDSITWRCRKHEPEIWARGLYVSHLHSALDSSLSCKMCRYHEEASYEPE